MPRGKKPPGRRSVLKSIAGVSAIGVAGCFGDPEPVPADDDVDDDPIEEDDDNDVEEEEDDDAGFWERDVRPRVSDRTQTIDIAQDCEATFEPDELPALAPDTRTQWDIRCAGYNLVVEEQPDGSTFEGHPDPAAEGDIPVRMRFDVREIGTYVLSTEGPDGDQATLEFEVLEPED